MLKDSFCSSPWFHVRLSYDGKFDMCRWTGQVWANNNVAGESIMEFYNGPQMRELRQQMLSGDKPAVCERCYYQDDHGKLSGRLRQLLKSGIQVDNFEITALSSPHMSMFQYSQDNQGLANYQPVDLQIDLGNTCNSACIMCNPKASSRLVTDYKKLHVIEPALFESPQPYQAWTRDPAKLTAIVDEIASFKHLKYIHFIGGETLYDDAFYAICERLINDGIASNIIIGTTTNGTVYDQRLERLIQSFKQFHLGISIETASPLNDYIRWPSNIDDVKSNIDKFVALREAYPGLYISGRVTPTVLSIYELDTLYEYLIDKHIAVESCNILCQPAPLKIELLPDDLRADVVDKLTALIDRYSLNYDNQAVNVRRPDLIGSVIANTLIEYRNFMKSYAVPDDVDEQRYKLVKFLKAFEAIRGNSIIDYVPNYEKFLRAYGY